MGEKDETLAVLVSKVDEMQADIREMRKDARFQQNTYVPRTEWNLWRQQQDKHHGRAWAVAAVVLAGGALSWSIVGPAVVGG